MTKILVGGAGGAPSEGVIRSLTEAGYHVVGMGSDPTDLGLSQASKRYLVPRADHPDYRYALVSVIEKVQPELIHFQNDLEVFHGSKLRDDILATGTRLFMPEHSVIHAAVHKHESWLAFRDAGIKVPRTHLIESPKDIDVALEELADHNGMVWFRSIGIGGGGTGALPTNDRQMAKAWIDHHSGWSTFSAAEMLTSRTVTWTSVWFDGDLIVSQGRERRAWTHGNRTLSGVTGVTKVGVTITDPRIDAISMKAVRAISARPHGIFSVDLAYDKDGVPNPTEINIARFFTTIYFFTAAGLNVPAMYADLGVNGTKPNSTPLVSPLPPGLLWLRGMDRQPRLIPEEELNAEFETVLP